jgi:UDP-N-acetylmuramoylalanine--D-glutamate ligase
MLARELGDENIRFETGGHSERVFDELDYAILSPGIPSSAPIVRELESRHLPLFSEIEVASWLCSAAIVAVTGTNGKSTTTAWLAHVLREAGRKALATGNIGSPLSGDVLKLGEDDFAVVEVSSFQLERIDTFRPHVALILNLTPDHLDRYQSVDEYAAAKYRIADNQTDEDYLVLNADDRNLREAKFFGNPTRIEFSTTQDVGTGVFVKDDTLSYSFGGRSGMICPTSDLGIPGPHNVANAAAVAAGALALGFSAGQIAIGLKSFTGIAHRIEHVAEINGVTYINDSKATNVDSVNYALQSVNRPIILIMGGRDKGGDFKSLAPQISARVDLIIVIGEASDKIAMSLGSIVPVQKVENLSKAVKLAASKAKPGDAVLLSPACASFDQFRDYEHRGDTFKEEVAKLKGERHE